MSSLLKTLGLRWAIIFTGLVWLGYPWPWHLLPHPGRWLSLPAAAAARWMGIHVIGIRHPAVYAIRSDSTGFYIHLLNAALVASLGAACWTALRGREEDRLRPLFVTALRYCLAIALLAYGLNKIFKWQFFLPEPATLYTLLGDTPRDLLYWSTIGASRPYSVFLGLCEVIPALLLLFRHTARAGGWTAAAVLANVVAVNFCYDISVKAMSAFLLLVAGLILLLAPRQASVRTVPGLPKPLGVLLKVLLVLWVLADAFYPYIASRNFNDDAAPRPPLHGAYEVAEAVRWHKSPALPGLVQTIPWKRFFIHRRGYFIVEGEGGSLYDYELETDTAGRTLLLFRSDGQPAGELRYQQNHDSLLLQGWTAGADSAYVRATPLPWRALPLLRDEFHWTSDD